MSQTQLALIPGRVISDDIMVGHECLHLIKNKKGRKAGLVAVKLDISKAYDRVEWSFLINMMIHLGFDIKWIDLIMNCISSINFSILINGVPKGSFSPSRGLRQGDSLSPYLFLLVTEGLSSLVQVANENGTLKRIDLPHEGPRLSHLLFADDSLIFCKADEWNVSNLKKLLKIYEDASGESINFPKSAIIFSPNVHKDRGIYLSNILGVQRLNDLGFYLGLPSTFSQNKSRDFQYIIDKVWKATQGWKRSFYSTAGKEVLIKSVGQALPTYAMSLFKLPKKLCEEITRGFARFWWGSTEGKRKLHWKKWSALCLPKALGGLNFRDLIGFNQALIAKQVWRILLNPKLLAAKILKSLYFQNESIMDASLGPNPSLLWKSLFWGKEILQKGLRYRVGNGKLVRLFKDPWIPRCSTFKPLVNSPDSENILVADFINDEGQWKVDELRKILPTEDVDIIRRIPTNKRTMDKWIWHFDKKRKIFGP